MSSRFSRGRYPLRRPPPVCVSKERPVSTPLPPPPPTWPQPTLYIDWDITDADASPPFHDAQTGIALTYNPTIDRWEINDPPGPATGVFVNVPVDGSGSQGVMIQFAGASEVNPSTPGATTGQPYNSGTIPLANFFFHSTGSCTLYL